MEVFERPGPEVFKMAAQYNRMQHLHPESGLFKTLDDGTREKRERTIIDQILKRLLTLLLCTATWPS